MDGGRYAAKSVAGSSCIVEADIFRDGHEIVRAVIRWKRAGATSYSESRLEHLGNDRWRGAFPTAENAEYTFTIQAWTDLFSSWLADFRKRVAAAQDVRSDAAEGVALLAGALKLAKGKETTLISDAMNELKARAGDAPAALKAVALPALEEAMTRTQDRWDAVTYAPELRLWVDRPRAEFGAWYEFFVRSETTDKSRSGTFATAEKRLPDIRAMGFDVLYLPPIHPIGRTARKGPNNSLVAGPSHPGSPWAIGNENGGHDTVEPSLGTIDDFDRFVARARALEMEVALDFAIQCSPDHPWVKAHPEWFYRRADGSIKYAENPPKKYEDIFPLNFDSPAADTLWQALLGVLLFWVKHDVKIFRVDNPHTKAFPFWEWAISEIRRDHPDVIFLAEAFTRPKPMKALAKLGFTQSYTYFTWRNEKRELMEYMTELAHTEMRDFYRPNFFANTPDILHGFLQNGGAAAFRIRAVLAATLSPTWGIYSGFELCENVPLPASEEYLDSEKFEIRPRDWNAPGNLRAYIQRLNAARRENPALQKLSNIFFLEIPEDQILGFVKTNADRSNAVIGIVSLDPFNSRSAWIRLPMERLGLPTEARFDVHDLLSGQTFNWGEKNWVQLSPEQPAHLLQVKGRTS